MTATIQNTSKRPFTIIYDDCFESDVFDNIYQKMVYMTLKKFADSNNQCFPSLKKIASVVKISKRKVQETLKELRDKFLIGIKSRFKPDGGRTSNLYTIYDIAGLWNADNEKETASPKNTSTILGEESVLKSKPETTSDSTTVKEATLKVVSEAEEDIEIKKEEPTSAPTKVTDVSTTNKLSKDDDTTSSPESQPLEKYPLNWIKERFEYNIMLHDNPSLQKDIDAIMDILYTAFNTTKSTLRINGEDKPPMVIIGKLMKLTKEDIEYVIDRFKEQADKIKNHTAYLLTMLYHAPEQRHLYEQNKLAQKNKPSEPEKQKNTYYNKPQNQFFQFHQREVTSEELDELERQLLRIGLQQADDIEKKKEKEEVAHELEQEVLENKKFKDTEVTDEEPDKLDELERKLLAN